MSDFAAAVIGCIIVFVIGFVAGGVHGLYVHISWLQNAFEWGIYAVVIALGGCICCIAGHH